MSDLKRVRLNVTITGYYYATAEVYGTDDPLEMAAIDIDNCATPEELLSFCEEVEATVKPDPTSNGQKCGVSSIITTTGNEKRFYECQHVEGHKGPHWYELISVQLG